MHLLIYASKARPQAQRVTEPGETSLPRCSMPMYGFICTACGTKFEELVHDTAAPVCPLCGSSGTERQMSAPSPLKTGAFPYKPGPGTPSGQRPALLRRQWLRQLRRTPGRLFLSKIIAIRWIEEKTTIFTSDDRRCSTALSRRASMTPGGKGTKTRRIPARQAATCSGFLDRLAFGNAHKKSLAKGQGLFLLSPRP